jgi:hypothetical protein
MSSFKLNQKLVITSIHIGICFLIYVMMFAMMTYNGTIIIAIILGNVVGYYLFGFSKKLKSRPIANVGCCHSG